jgi:hypothetical protein
MHASPSPARPAAHRRGSPPARLAGALAGALALSPTPARAADRELEVVGGIGLSTGEKKAPNGSAGDGAGAFLEADYAFTRSRWFTPKLYGGLALTFPDRKSCGPEAAICDVSAQIGFVGAKARLMAPIPYFGPFLELGFGGSVGRLYTRNGTVVDESRVGLMFHIPLAVGIGFGARNQYAFSFSSLIHPTYAHTLGAFAVGLSFPLD